MKWTLPQEEQESLISMRRRLHRFPELSWEEKNTSKRVIEYLEKLGLSPRSGIAKTGVFVDIGTEGLMVALRADMDALPIQEETALPFASERPGVMHACGHDGHTAGLLAVARRLVDEPPKKGRVRLIFQPAEEIGSGADQMIREGVLSDSQLVAIYGLHYWSQYPMGKIGLCDGPAMGSVDFFTIRIVGRGGHGAAPHRTADPIVAAAHFVSAAQTLVSRRIDPLASVVVSFGEIHAGTAPNIIPQDVTIRGTARTLDHTHWEKMPSLLQEILEHSVAAFGCTASIEWERLQRPLVNHVRETEIVRQVAREWVKEENVGVFRTLAGEDFAAYLEKVPGCFFFVGASPHQEPTRSAPHHHPAFQIDEDALALGVRLLEGCARKELEQR